MEKCTFLSFVNSLVRNISLLTYFFVIADDKYFFSYSQFCCEIRQLCWKKFIKLIKIK